MNSSKWFNFRHVKTRGHLALCLNTTVNTDHDVCEFLSNVKYDTQFTLLVMAAILLLPKQRK